MKLFRSKRYVYHDGGRKEAGFHWFRADCAVRAIAIAADLPYTNVREALEGMAYAQNRQCVDGGVHRETYHPLLMMMGWTWIAPDEPTYLKNLPTGHVICRLPKHLVAVIDRVPHDTHDSLHKGKRDILSYYLPPS